MCTMGIAALYPRNKRNTTVKAGEHKVYLYALKQFHNEGKQVIVEHPKQRFFRTLKYEEVYLKEYQHIKELKTRIKRFIDFYHHNRLHASLDYDKPMNVYRSGMEQAA